MKCFKSTGSQSLLNVSLMLVLWAPVAETKGAELGYLNTPIVISDTVITAKVTIVKDETCRINNAQDGCYVHGYFVKYEGSTVWDQVAGRGMPTCYGVGPTTRSCWEGANITFTVPTSRLITGVKVGLKYGNTAEDVKNENIRPPSATCTTTSTAITLADMHPGSSNHKQAVDNLKVRCNVDTSLRVYVLTPRINYTPGAYSIVTAPSKVSVERDATTGVPINIATHVERDTVAGNYTQSIVMRIEHD